MRRKLMIIIAVLGIVIFGIAAVFLSVQQDRRRKVEIPQGNTATFDDTLQPTPTLQTAASTAADSPATIQITHTVRSGETLLVIALSYDVAVEDIINANSMEDPDLLDVGQELIVPGVALPTLVPPASANLSVEQEELILTKPANVAVNGLTETSFIIMPQNVIQHAKEIFLRGQRSGRNAQAFSVVGDSTTEIPFFLARFDQGPYELGEYEYLQSVINHFSGSYSRDSVAVRVGLHSYTLFDPVWADKTVCLPNEAVLACEIRLNNPSVIFLRLGSNDVGVSELFDESMRQAVQYAIDNGVIPIIGTKADRFEGSNQNNDILREIATDFQVPLWEYDIVAGTMGGRGLDVDAVHMTTFYPHDYTQPEAFQRGHAMHNLTALMMLDTIWKEVILASQR